MVLEIEDRYSEGGRSTPNGNFVRINYDDRTEGVFLHLLEVFVEGGQGIGAGEVIGTSNDTGRSSGPHLHYTQYDESDTPVNPVESHASC